MKTIIISAVVMLVFISCGSKNTKKDSSAKQETPAVADTHNSRNSLDFAGVYEGTIPCADCPGIKVAITLDSEGNYTKTMTYIDKEPNNVFTDKGRFEWDDSGSNITLKGGKDTEMYKVGENRLFMLDKEGNRITGSLADKYVLNKK